jgi:hypothetical protein
VDQIMPDWILGPVGVVLLAGFIFYAFRQGTKVHPDRNNIDFGPNHGSMGGDSGSGSDSSGHSF